MSRWLEYKKKIGESRPWDALKPSEYLDDTDAAQKRMLICEDCPRLIRETKQCRECGCFMKLKTKLANAKCPIGKW